MRKVFSHHDRFRVWQVKQLLEDNQIPCFIKNEYAIGAMGELSPLDVLPEVWLTDEEWSQKAKALISKLLESNAGEKEWHCDHCNEDNDASFEVCWQCGQAQDH